MLARNRPHAHKHTPPAKANTNKNMLSWHSNTLHCSVCLRRFAASQWSVLSWSATSADCECVCVCVCCLPSSTLLKNSPRTIRTLSRRLCACQNKLTKHSKTAKNTHNPSGRVDRTHTGRFSKWTQQLRVKRYANEDVHLEILTPKIGQRVELWSISLHLHLHFQHLVDAFIQ